MVFWRHSGRTSPARLVLARRRRLGEGSTAGGPWGAGRLGKPMANGRAPAQPCAPSRHGAHVADEPTRVVGALGDPVTGGLAGTDRRDGGWVCRKFQMAEDLADDLALRDDGDEPQRSALAKRAGGHIHVKYPLEQPRPAPTPRPGVRLLGQPLLAWRGDDAPAQMAVRRQTAPIAHQMDVGQGDQRRELLQKFQRREANPRRPVRPWVGEDIDEIAVGVLRQPL
jgi:hypothetical protein